MTGVEVVGDTANDVALNVHFEEETIHEAWFAPELVLSGGRQAVTMHEPALGAQGRRKALRSGRRASAAAKRSGKWQYRIVVALLLATGMVACNGSPGTSASMGEAPTTVNSLRRDLPPDPDSASAYEVMVSPRSAGRGTALTITATLPAYCLAAPGRVSVTLADEELQRAGRAGSGKRVPHQVIGSTLRATYTITDDDSTGKGLVVIRCDDLGGNGLGAFEITR